MKKFSIQNKNSAFTIIEISISLAIIALLIAAITAGQNIKTKLELNQVIEDIGIINTANKSFMESYNGKPGDIWNATTVLGSSTSNGDGDEVIEAGTPNEQLLFWQHLALAGLIKGSYDGTSNNKNGRMKPSLKYGIYGVATDTTLTNKPTYITLSKFTTVDSNGLLTTKQASDIDSKYDDSNPTTGTIRAIDGIDVAASSCVSSGAYNLANNDNTPCVLKFYLGL